MFKICNKCKNELDITTNFHKNSQKKDGHQNICKACIKLSINKNKEKLRLEKYKNNGQLQKSREIYIQTDKYKQTLIKYYQTDIYKNRTKTRRNTPENKLKLKIYRSSDEFKAKRRQQRKDPSRRAKERLYEKQRLKTDINFKLKKYLRSRLRDALLKNSKVGSAILLLGCSITEFKNYLEKRFRDGMSWNNYGKWHIDHIKPLALFDLTKIEDLKLACHYTNLQPLWAIENLIKGAKYD